VSAHLHQWPLHSRKMLRVCTVNKSRGDTQYGSVQVRMGHGGAILGEQSVQGSVVVHLHMSVSELTMQSISCPNRFWPTGCSGRDHCTRTVAVLIVPLDRRVGCVCSPTQADRIAINLAHLLFRPLLYLSSQHSGYFSYHPRVVHGQKSILDHIPNPHPAPQTDRSLRNPVPRQPASLPDKEGFPPTAESCTILSPARAVSLHLNARGSTCRCVSPIHLGPLQKLTCLRLRSLPPVNAWPPTRTSSDPSFPSATGSLWYAACGSTRHS
jgi:hypothetical protein